jgi:hypothetical protein
MKESGRAETLNGCGRRGGLSTSGRTRAGSRPVCPYAGWSRRYLDEPGLHLALVPGVVSRTPRDEVVRRVAGRCRSGKHVLAEVGVYRGHKYGTCRACAGTAFGAGEAT